LANPVCAANCNKYLFFGEGADLSTATNPCAVNYNPYPGTGNSRDCVTFVPYPNITNCQDNAFRVKGTNAGQANDQTNPPRRRDENACDPGVDCTEGVNIRMQTQTKTMPLAPCAPKLNKLNGQPIPGTMAEPSWCMFLHILMVQQNSQVSTVFGDSLLGVDLASKKRNYAPVGMTPLSRTLGVEASYDSQQVDPFNLDNIATTTCVDVRGVAYPCNGQEEITARLNSIANQFTNIYAKALWNKISSVAGKVVVRGFAPIGSSAPQEIDFNQDKPFDQAFSGNNPVLTIEERTTITRIGQALVNVQYGSGQGMP
jgi:hypothetical protein